MAPTVRSRARIGIAYAVLGASSRSTSRARPDSTLLIDSVASWMTIGSPVRIVRNRYASGASASMRRAAYVFTVSRIAGSVCQAAMSRSWRWSSDIVTRHHVPNVGTRWAARRRTASSVSSVELRSSLTWASRPSRREESSAAARAVRTSSCARRRSEMSSR